MEILIIEDTQQVSRFLKRKIETWGHKVTVAATGQDALEVVKMTMFDLILVDIFLPDTVAYDLIPKLKQGWSGMKIITMTGYSTKEVEEKVRSLGILYYMVKPVDLNELESILSHLTKRLESSL
ncbi:MAG: response regulator [Desulfobacteraceae bacterium]|nr:response regulator [Desulfobacteraceae bacterium]